MKSLFTKITIGITVSLTWLVCLYEIARQKETHEQGN